MGVIIGNQSLWSPFTTKQFSKSLKSEVLLQEQTTISFIHTLPRSVGMWPRYPRWGISLDIEYSPCRCWQYISAKFMPPDRLLVEWFHLGNPDVTWMEISKNWLAQLRIFGQVIPSGQMRRSSHCCKFSGNFLLVLHCQPDLRDLIVLPRNFSIPAKDLLLKQVVAV